MDELLRQLAERLGIQTDQAEVGAGALLNMIRESASRLDFEQLLKAVPEAASWMGTAASAAQGGGPASGGFLGEIGGLIGSLTGGAAGGLGGLLSALGHSGLSPDKLAQFVPELLSLLQQRGGADLLERLAGSVPLLRDFFPGR
jgi:hypothetical protein